MNKFENWTEISKGYYRYVLAPGCAYEIFIEFWNLATPIETATGSLCIVGEWYNPTHKRSTLEREWILKEQPVSKLLEAAVEDNEQNNK